MLPYIKFQSRDVSLKNDLDPTFHAFDIQPTKFPSYFYH